MKRLAMLPGAWQRLFGHAMRLIDDIGAHHIRDPVWIFGGGTVLMLRHGHRRSKDVDLFVPDPQYLGYITPRLSDVAAGITDNYVEAAGYVKLILEDGEIDFVAAPNLTRTPFEVRKVLGRRVKVETSAEIVAKKMWHRGDMASARDLFDLALVIRQDPHALIDAGRYLVRHRQAFLDQLRSREAILRKVFAGMDFIGAAASFDECVAIATEFLAALPAGGAVGGNSA